MKDVILKTSFFLTDKTGIYLLDQSTFVLLVIVIFKKCWPPLYDQVTANDLQMLVDEKVSWRWKENKQELLVFLHTSGGWSQEAKGRSPFCGEGPAQPTRKDPQEKSGQSFRLIWENLCALQTIMNITIYILSFSNSSIGHVFCSCTSWKELISTAKRCS